MTRFLRCWAQMVFRVKIRWLALAGHRLERRIEGRKRQPLRSL